MTPADLAVVVPTRERWPVLRRTLAALAAQTAPGFETVVVVDGADQRVPPGLPEPAGGLRLVTAERGGPGAARNLGARATERPLLLFLGDDMVPGPGLVAAHLARHAAAGGPEVAVLGRVEWHPEARSPLADWLDWSGAQFDFAAIDGDEAGWGRFYSCNVSLGRRLFLDAGGFDEDFAYYYEDLDCGWRLHRQGMRLLYEPTAVARHLHAYDWPALERRVEGVAAGERLMAAKHDWFTPFFARRARRAAAAPPVSRLWAVAAARVPARPAALRRRVEGRADRWYWQRLAPAFERGWGAPVS